MVELLFLMSIFVSQPFQYKIVLDNRVQVLTYKCEYYTRKGNKLTCHNGKKKEKIDVTGYSMSVY